MRAHPSARFMTLRPAAEPSNGAASALPGSPQSKRGLLSGIIELAGDFLGFGNSQAHPAHPKDTGSGASSTPSSHEPTGDKPPTDHPTSPAQPPPASYPAPGGGGQGDKPTSTASIPPASVSLAPIQSGSVGTEAGPAPHSTSPSDAMNVVPTLSTAPAMQDQAHSLTDAYAGASHTISPAGWQSISPPARGATSSAPSPTDHTPPAEHEKRFPLPAAAAIGAVLGLLVVSALFWAVWLALRRRRRAYPEFASVHPKRMLSVPDTDENPFVHPRDEKEDDPFDAALCRASTARSMASTLSV